MSAYADRGPSPSSFPSTPAGPATEPPGVECLHCASRYDPIASRWLCPACKQKTVTCCEGAPLPECRSAGGA